MQHCKNECSKLFNMCKWLFFFIINKLLNRYYKFCFRNIIQYVLFSSAFLYILYKYQLCFQVFVDWKEKPKQGYNLTNIAKYSLQRDNIIMWRVAYLKFIKEVCVCMYISTSGYGPDRKSNVIWSCISSSSPSLTRYSTELTLQVQLICALQTYQKFMYLHSAYERCPQWKFSTIVHQTQ